MTFANQKFGLVLGVLACCAVALAAGALAGMLSLPAVLMALVAGLALRPAALRLAWWPGIDFSARMLLRIGIVFIGFRLSLADIMVFGMPAIAIGLGAVVMMLTVGYTVGRVFGLTRDRSFLSAGSVGICGASAALAISTVLRPTPELERQTVFTICAVTILSTIAMVAYPTLVFVLGLSDIQAGLFFGGSIHDVTQVIGAGAIVSPQATEAATVTKLIRVAALAPAVVVVGLAVRRSHLEAAATAAAGTIGKRAPLVPWFVIGFVLAAVLANVNILPDATYGIAADITLFCLMTATVALGLKTDVRALMAEGWRPIAAVIVQTVLLAMAVLAAAMVLIA